jgi:hypothetical protein
LKEEVLGVHTAAEPQHKIVNARTGQNNTAAMGNTLITLASGYLHKHNDFMIV